MKITKLLEEIQDIPNPQKEFWVIENPRNGLQVHYTDSEEEAIDWVNKVDPDGMLDFNIRQLEGETPTDDLSPEQKANVFVREAKKNKEEEPADEEPEDEEPADEDVEFGDVENPEQTIQTNLQSALEAAKSLGDDTLTQQIGNTITFFTRKFVVGLEDEDGKDAQIPSPSPEEPSELDEIYRNKMLRIAGILK